MKYSTEELETAYAEINSNANPTYAIVGATIGTLPGIALYFFFGEMGGALYIMLALPPIIVGYFAKFIGRTYSVKHRIGVGLIGATLHVFGCYLVQFSPLIYLLTPAAFAISFFTAKVKLNSIQNWAVAEVAFGKLNTNK